MSQKAYQLLIDKLCTELNIEIDPSIYTVCALSFANIDFVLRHFEQGEASDIMIYADYGQPPESIREKVFQKLMENNFFSFGGEKFKFGYDRPSQKVFLIRRMSVYGATVESLLSTMMEITSYIAGTQASLYELTVPTFQIENFSANQTLQ